MVALLTPLHLGGSSSVMLPHQKAPDPPHLQAALPPSLLAFAQGAPMSRLGQHFRPLPVPGSAALGLFPKDQMVSLGTFAQSSCHWQEMTKVDLRKVAWKWGPGAWGYGVQLL